MRRVLGGRLILRAALTVGLVRIGLWLSSYRFVAKFVRLKAERPEATEGEARRICLAVAYTSGYIPRASCLTQAVAAQIMLARRGYASTVRVGAKRDLQRRFSAHAWLVRNGEVMLGGSDEQPVGQFNHLLDLEAPRS